MTIHKDGFVLRKDTRHGVMTDWSYLQQLEDGSWCWASGSNAATVLSWDVAQFFARYLRADGLFVRVRPDALRREPSVCELPERFVLAA